MAQRPRGDHPPCGALYDATHHFIGPLHDAVDLAGVPRHPGPGAWPPVTQVSKSPRSCRESRTEPQLPELGPLRADAAEAVGADEDPPGRGLLPALHAESQRGAAGPIEVLRHLCHQEGERPQWLRRWRSGLFRDAQEHGEAPSPFDIADYENRLYSAPEELRDELDHLLLHAVASPLDSRPVSPTTLIRLALLWCRAESWQSPGARSVIGVLGTVHGHVATNPNLTWLSPEVLLAATHCVADVAPAAAASAIQDVVHSAVVEDQILPLVAALLLDAEGALENSDGHRADRVLRTLARHLKALSESESLSDSRVFPIGTSPGMLWLTRSPSHGARLLIASAWRHWRLGDSSRALGELDELGEAIRQGMECPSVFRSQGAWLRAVVARDTGQLPAMDRYLAEAAALDLEHLPVRSTLAQVRRLTYLWKTGQQQHLQRAVHQDLGPIARRLDGPLEARLLELRAEFSRGVLSEVLLADLEECFIGAVERATPWF